MDSFLAVVNQFSYNGALFASVENMIIWDSNPMQSLTKNMKKVKKYKVPFLKDCFHETFHKVKYFARRLKYICDSIFIQSKKTGLSWKYGYVWLCGLYGLVLFGRATS